MSRWLKNWGKSSVVCLWVYSAFSFSCWTFFISSKYVEDMKHADDLAERNRSYGRWQNQNSKCFSQGTMWKSNTPTLPQRALQISPNSAVSSAELFLICPTWAQVSILAQPPCWLLSPSLLQPMPYLNRHVRTYLYAWALGKQEPGLIIGK